jgi:N utilization substance protein A
MLILQLANALSPAKDVKVSIKDETKKEALALVNDKNLSLAIGKKGQNARLAAKLTNWKIDIKSESQFREMIQELQANGEEKEETADAENVDETNVEEANEVENVETSEENKDEE